MGDKSLFTFITKTDARSLHYSRDQTDCETHSLRPTDFL